MSPIAALSRRPSLSVWLITLAIGLPFTLLGHDRFLHSVAEGLSDEYDEIATQLVRSGEFSVAPGRPTVIRGPIYPLYLAGLFRLAGVGNTIAVAVGDMVIHATTAALLAGLLVRCAGGAGALAAGLAFAFWPTTFYYAAKGSSETMLTLGLVATAAAAVALRADPTLRRAALLGALFALACLTRGSAVATAGACIAALAIAFRPRAALLRLAVVALAWAAVMAPWWARNAAVTDGAFVPFHTLTWYNAYHDDVYDERRAWLRARGDHRVELGSVPPAAFPASVLRHPDGFVYPAGLEAREDLAQEGRYRALMASLYREPGYLAAKVGRNVVDFWSASSSASKDRILLASSLAWLALYAAAFAIAWRRREFRGLLLTGLVAIAATMALYLPVFAIFRHSIPTAPFVAGTIGLAVGAMTRRHVTAPGA